MKGNCALFGIDSVAALCHAIEDRIDDSASLLDADCVRLSQTWTLVTKTRRAELVELALRKPATAVAREDYQRLCDDLRRYADHETMLAVRRGWELEPASKRLAPIREQIERLATRLGRAPVDVICHPTTRGCRPALGDVLVGVRARRAQHRRPRRRDQREAHRRRQARARHYPRRHRDVIATAS